MLWDQEYLLREIKLIKIGSIKDIRNKHGWYELRKKINYNPKNEYLREHYRKGKKLTK